MFTPYLLITVYNCSIFSHSNVCQFLPHTIFTSAIFVHHWLQVTEKLLNFVKVNFFEMFLFIIYCKL